MTQRDAEWLKSATPEQIETAFFGGELADYMAGTEDPAWRPVHGALPDQAEELTRMGFVLLDDKWIPRGAADLINAARAAGRPEQVTSDELTAEAQRVLDEAGPVQRDDTWVKSATPEELAAAFEKGELTSLLQG